MEQWSTKEQLRKLLTELVRIPTVTGSDAELSFPSHIMQHLLSLPYFSIHPDYLRLIPTGDGRNAVTALVKRPDIRKTVVLISHYDVVDVPDYGVWQDFAFHAEELTTAFYTRKHDLPPEVQSDLETGDWLFGRGTMDMKCGLVLHMSMVEQAANGAFDGNILLLTVPDEEVNSLGMRAVVPQLLEFAEQHGLEYCAVLNSEPMFSRYPGDPNQYLYMGSLGKVLPGFLCYGKETHVGEPFSGLNANQMASLLTTEMELNSKFCEILSGEVTPPPTNLLQKDLKDAYSVQIPHRAVTLFNVFVLERRMDELLDLLRQSAQRAASAISSSYLTRAQEFSRFQALPATEPNVAVLTYGELVTYALNTYGKEQVEQVQAEVLHQAALLDVRELSIRLVDRLAILCKELSPMIVLFFAPPYYPAVASGHDKAMQQVVAAVVAKAKQTYGIELTPQPYFPGISDLSYIGRQPASESLAPLLSNIPSWQTGYSLPLKEIEKLNLPVLNLGPVGKDAHQWTERLDVNYAFGPLRNLLKTAIQHSLKTF
ncbi:M20/M25/M40 family metallo-hydrolase [Alicyclobacillus tolerans]|uniref:M20/M25/M40 family metallo-hydrolase n=1 Tax=Alicyclobacillus tolerans TaxID=90970 RepID=UPI001F29ABCE|nr:M20/M25/M40 family metallo-hydrolase [Alicyclobacillus tolerans]MCF8568554.1 M20/M25/M40 family metallo-hydrolase [Alicyclobacillus tolerans]